MGSSLTGRFRLRLCENSVSAAASVMPPRLGPITFQIRDSHQEQLPG